MDYKGQPPQYEEHAQSGQYGLGQANRGYSAPSQYPPQQYGQFMNQSTSSSNVVVQGMDRGAVGVMQAAPVDYTTQAFIACLCCFWPTGIIAIMKAQESRDALAVGDLGRAHAAADSARSMVRISFGIGLASLTIAVVIVIVYVAVIMSAFH